MQHRGLEAVGAEQPKAAAHPWGCGDSLEHGLGPASFRAGFISLLHVEPSSLQPGAAAHGVSGSKLGDMDYLFLPSFPFFMTLLPSNPGRRICVLSFPCHAQSH